MVRGVGWIYQDLHGHQTWGHGFIWLCATLGTGFERHYLISQLPGYSREDWWWPFSLPWTEYRNPYPNLPHDWCDWGLAQEVSFTLKCNSRWNFIKSLSRCCKLHGFRITSRIMNRFENNCYEDWRNGFDNFGLDNLWQISSQNWWRCLRFSNVLVFLRRGELGRQISRILTWSRVNDISVHGVNISNLSKWCGGWL